MKGAVFNKKHLAMIGFSFLLVASLTLSFVPPQQQVAAESSDYKLVGYYTAWSPPTNLDPKKLTHINYAFADICWEGEQGAHNDTTPCDEEDGTVVLGDPEADPANLEKLKQLKTENPELKTLVSIGGWSWSKNIALAAATEETRQVFAESAVDYVQTYGMDGVDLDWEFPGAPGAEGNHILDDDPENHVLLLQAIRDALDEAGKEDGKEYLLTIASSVSFAYLDSNGPKFPEIADIVDFINIMAYDFNGAWATTSAHNAPLYEDSNATEAGVHPYNIEAAVQRHLDEGVPADQLVLGLPFYGRSWGGCNEETNGEMVDNGGYQPCSGAGGGNAEPGVYDYGYIQENFIDKGGYKRYWNDEARVPYLYNEEKGEIISYDDPHSLYEKAEFIKNQGLAGGMIWELSQDADNSILLSSISSALGLSEFSPPSVPEPEDPEDPKDDGDDNGEDNGEDNDEDDGEDDENGKDNGDNDGNGGNGDDEDNGDNGDGVDDDKTPPEEDEGNDQGGEKLPETATNSFNFLLIGGVLLLIGIGVYVYQRRRLN